VVHSQQDADNNDHYRTTIWYYTFRGSGRGGYLKLWSVISVELGVAWNDVRHVFDIVPRLVGSHMEGGPFRPKYVSPSEI